jgi:hypothetical protein
MYENERDRAYTSYDRREGREQSAVINGSRPEALPPSFASGRGLSSKRTAGEESGERRPRCMDCTGAMLQARRGAYNARGSEGCSGLNL